MTITYDVKVNNTIGCQHGGHLVLPGKQMIEFDNGSLCISQPSERYTGSDDWECLVISNVHGLEIF